MPRIQDYLDASALTGSEFAVVSQGGVTRRTSVQSIANKAPSAVPSTASDPRDFVRAWLPPYNVSPNAAAADNRAGIQAAIVAARNGAANSSANVKLPSGTININGAIVVEGGLGLYGQASHGPGATILKLSAGANTAVITDPFWAPKTIQWVHGLQIAKMVLDGNRAQNSGHSVVEIRALGEQAQIIDTKMINGAVYGFHQDYNPAPHQMRSCHFENNAAGGIRSDYHGSQVWDSISGLGNLGPLFTFHYGTGASHVIINSSADGHGAQPIVLLDGFLGQCLVIGGTWRNEPPTGSQTDHAIRIIGQNPKGIHVGGLYLFNYASLIHDQINNVRIATGAPQHIGEVHYAVPSGGGITGFANGCLRLAIPGLGLTACPGITSGAGAPPATLALPNSTIYLRIDGAAGSTIYARIGGAWVARA